MHSFGQNLRQLRQQKRVSLNEFAKELGVSPAYLSNLETGKTRTIQLEVLDKLQSELRIVPVDMVNFQDTSSLRIQRLATLLKELHTHDPKAAEYLMELVEKGVDLFQGRTGNIH